MILKINNQQFDYFHNLVVNLRYDSVSSGFSFGAYFSELNDAHLKLFKPLQYAEVVIEENNEVLLTGKLLSHGFKSSSAKELTGLSGYSKTGVLEDVDIPTSHYPLQYHNLSLRSIAEKLLKPFNLKVIVDESVSKAANKNYTDIIAKEEKKIKDFLNNLAAQRHIMLSHNEKGDLLLTEVKSQQQPIYHFTKGMNGVAYDFPIDGQNMHSYIEVIKQASHKHPNAGQAKVTNPYVTEFRPMVARQSSGDDIDTKYSARNKLSEELKNIKLTITMNRWLLDKKIVRPNNTITVTNPDLYLFKETKFFIESVDLTGDALNQQATLTCYLPEVYNNETPKNIFDQ